MDVDVHFYCSVPMDDAGAGAPAATDRRYGQADYLACYENLEHWAKTADGLGYSTMWLTEHHFQYEGYEVVPNLVQFGQHLASLTERIKFGQAFNVVPQWHPLRLAEDFAMADVLTRGRMVFGVGRGTVPRESETLGGVVASGDNEMALDRDRLNREIFEEAMEVIREAWGNETFSYTGKHFVFPPPGIPDRGSTVKDLTLVPKPLSYPELPKIYQPVTSPPTMDYVARVGHQAIFAGGPVERVGAAWDLFADKVAGHGRTLSPGEGRAFHINVHVNRTTEAAIASGRAGHDEYVKFLSPYGRFKQYNGGNVPFDNCPTVEETMQEESMAIGSIEQVADLLGRLKDRLDLQHLLLFPDFPGLTREEMDEQMHLLAEEVLPRIGVTLT
jgi:alkanesulfonate monooxygenase SsuD/methylene tetrahydromethanopterin reductase-like flavin-dependent oxidoreductase (luciferase family)